MQKTIPSVSIPTTQQPKYPQIRILQINTHQSMNITTPLFNNPQTQIFHVLIIQEPPTSWGSTKAAVDPNWHVIEPLTDDSYVPTDDTRPKSFIYVNKNLPSHSFSQLLTNFLNIAGIKLTLLDPQPPLQIILAYLPPGWADVMHTLTPIVTIAGRATVLLGMDSNLHNPVPVWNPPQISPTHTTHVRTRATAPQQTGCPDSLL